MPSTQPRVVHVIPNLRREGAQQVLLNLLQHGTEGFAHAVVSLADDVPLRAPVEAAGATVTTLGAQSPRDALAVLPRLRAVLREQAPALVHGWLYHGNVAASLAASRRVPVVWSVHHTDLPRDGIGTATRTVAWVARRLAARSPRAIVYVSRSGRDLHEAQGYPTERGAVIANGFAHPDVDRDAARRALLQELDLPPSTVLVARVGRWDPQKDHATFLSAAPLVLGRHPEAAFVLCGTGIDRDNPELVGLAEAAGVGGRTHLLGSRDDVPRILAAADVSVSSSRFGEAMPMVIGESMAVGTPVVTTDVGDSRWLVGDAGVVVPVSDPTALGDALADLLAHPERRRAMGEAGRRRVDRDLSLSAMSEAYATTYGRVLGR